MKNCTSGSRYSSLFPRNIVKLSSCLQNFCGYFFRRTLVSLLRKFLHRNFFFKLFPTRAAPLNITTNCYCGYFKVSLCLFVALTSPRGRLQFTRSKLTPLVYSKQSQQMKNCTSGSRYSSLFPRNIAKLSSWLQNFCGYFFIGIFSKLVEPRQLLAEGLFLPEDGVILLHFPCII